MLQLGKYMWSSVATSQADRLQGKQTNNSTKITFALNLNGMTHLLRLTGGKAGRGDALVSLVVTVK